MQHVARVDAPTGVALIHVDASGQNSITVVAGANARADPDAVPDSLLASGATLLIRGTVSSVTRHGRESALQLQLEFLCFRGLGVPHRRVV